jgi:cation-transporting P-type ATPase D
MKLSVFSDTGGKSSICIPNLYTSEWQRMYHNCKMVSSNGDFLAYTDLRRMEWYIERGLAERVTDREFKLTFQHKSRGNDSYASEALPRQSICVVCGTGAFLERHHVVPHCFRRYFRPEYKHHNSHDVVPLCVSCHDDYERYANKEKDALRAAVTDIEEFKNTFSLLKAAKGLLSHKDSLPDAVKTKLWERLPASLGRSESALQSFVVEMESKRDQLSAWAGRIVSRDGEDAVSIFWRKHFLAHAKPQYLPEFWEADIENVLAKRI